MLWMRGIIFFKVRNFTCIIHTGCMDGGEIVHCNAHYGHDYPFGPNRYFSDCFFFLQFSVLASENQIMCSVHLSLYQVHRELKNHVGWVNGIIIKHRFSYNFIFRLHEGAPKAVLEDDRLVLKTMFWIIEKIVETFVTNVIFYRVWVYPQIGESCNCWFIVWWVFAEEE